MTWFVYSKSCTIILFILGKYDRVTMHFRLAAQPDLFITVTSYSPSLLIDIVGVISPVDHKYVKSLILSGDIIPEFNNMEGF
jgi:hypothetical protein